MLRAVLCRREKDLRCTECIERLPRGDRRWVLGIRRAVEMDDVTMAREEEMGFACTVFEIHEYRWSLEARLEILWW